MRTTLVVVCVLAAATSTFADRRDEERDRITTTAILRIMKEAESKTSLSGKDFAKQWRKSIATYTTAVCSCTDPTVFRSALNRQHCAKDAGADFLLDLFPVLMRVPGYLDGFKAAIKKSEAEAGAESERMVRELLDEWVPSKEQLRVMKRMYECIQR